MSAAPGDLLPIGAFAKAIGISVSAARFYADRELLMPAHTDPATGYRFFAPAQVPQGRLVRDLRLIGVPLASVREALDLGPIEVKQLAEQHVALLEAGLDDARRTVAELGGAPRRVEPSDQTTVEAHDLARAFTQTLPFACHDGEHPHLMTLLIEVNDEAIRVVASDTHRLAVREIAPRQTGQSFSALISVAGARRLLDDLAAVDSATLNIDDNAFVVTEGDQRVSSPLIPATFPSYEQILVSHDATTWVTVDQSALLGGLGAVADTGAVIEIAAEGGQAWGQRASWRRQAVG